MGRRGGVLKNLVLVFSMLVLPSLVLKCLGDKKMASGRRAQGGKKAHPNRKLQIMWRQFIPSEGSLQPYSVIQHFGRSEPVNYCS